MSGVSVEWGVAHGTSRLLGIQATRYDRVPGIWRMRMTRPTRPTFTPRQSDPRPTFTPREGYLPPPDTRQRLPPTAYMPAVGVPLDLRQGPAGSGPDTQPNLARSGLVMALGTLVSRGTGFLRTFVLTGATWAWPLQLRRVGSLDGQRIGRSLALMFLAALPGLLFALAAMTVVGWEIPAPSALYGLVSTVIGGGGALVLYAVCAKLLGIDEFAVLARSVAGRLGRLRRYRRLPQRIRQHRGQRIDLHVGRRGDFLVGAVDGPGGKARLAVD
jgi:hypothetical protein